MEEDNVNMNETSADIKGFNLRPFNTSQSIVTPEKEGPSFDPDGLYYDMSGEKYLVILNHHTFKKTRYFKGTKPATRNGTEKDVKSLKSLFEGFGFKVTVFQDLEYGEIMDNLTAVAKQDHSKTSCISVAILTHGDKGNELFAAERPYCLSDLTTIFDTQKSLVNKPKLFFIQACRGDKIDSGYTVQLDSVSIMTLPTHSDFLILCSTVEDYLSYRDANGSWIIQALCKIISKHHQDMDLLQMITLVNRKVAYERQTYIPRNWAMHNKKQMPETRFTLTKLFKFR